MNAKIINAASIDGKIAWNDVIQALHDGHKRPRAEIKDIIIGAMDHSFLNRAAWIDGLGGGIKSVTVFPNNPSKNPDLPTVQGVFLLFDEGTGALKAIIDGPLITHWKTAADSVLGARLLARKGAARVLIIGAGALAASLVEAYGDGLPQLENIGVWGRQTEKAERVAKNSGRANVRAIDGDLEDAVRKSDIIVTATSSPTPVLLGEWVGRGTHVDLVGAFRSDMREADDALMRKGRIFVDSYETTIAHIGELAIPIASGVILPSDVLGDLYALVAGLEGRRTDDDITIFKNGGGAHLDVMTAALMCESV